MSSKTASFWTKPLVFGLILSSALMLGFQLPVRADQSVVLTWQPSSATNVADYKIYYGTESQNYTNEVTVGVTTNATLSGLLPGQTYYFAATTFNGAGIESSFSNEATYVAPVMPATLAAPAQAGGQFSFAVSGSAGQSYVVQASTDLLNWVSIQTNTVPFVFTDPDAASFNQRFYRAFSLTP